VLVRNKASSIDACVLPRPAQRQLSGSVSSRGPAATSLVNKRCLQNFRPISVSSVVYMASTADTPANPLRYLEQAIVQSKAKRDGLVEQIGKNHEAVSGLPGTRLQDGERARLAEERVELNRQLALVDEEIKEAQETLARCCPAAQSGVPPASPNRSAQTADRPTTPASDDIASQASAYPAISASASTHKFVPRDLPKFRDGPN
jgi:hypothetical protein